MAVTLEFRLGETRSMMRRQGLPLYREIEAAIRADIETGTYAVGADLPTEAEFCEKYDVSRVTIREALRRIEDAGLIERQQGRVSRLTSRSPQRAFVPSGPSEMDVLRDLDATTVQLRSVRERMSYKLACELALDDRDQWIHYTGLQHSMQTNTRVAAFDAYVDREYDVVLNGISDGQPIFSAVVEKYGLRMAYIDQTISASLLPSRFARRLNAAAGEPAFRIVRKFVAHDAGMFQVTVSYNPADRFQYHCRFEAREHQIRADLSAADRRS
jgi:GntR family transcriptional regulator